MLRELWVGCRVGVVIGGQQGEGGDGSTGWGGDEPFSKRGCDEKLFCICCSTSQSPTPPLHACPLSILTSTLLFGGVTETQNADQTRGGAVGGCSSCGARFTSEASRDADAASSGLSAAFGETA